MLGLGDAVGVAVREPDVAGVEAIGLHRHVGLGDELLLGLEGTQTIRWRFAS